MSRTLGSAQVFEAELVLELLPSRLLLSFMLMTNLVILTSVCFMPLSGWWKLGLILLISLISFYEWRSQLSLGNRNFSTLLWRETGGWEILSAQGKLHAAPLIQHFSSKLLTILHLQVQGSMQVVIFLPDNLDAVSAQVLRRRLKLLT
ncbi:MAG: hypothetical protein E6Q85_00700 [Thiothrix sp.]|nr:MAG: hypothetical protein E6Q85_00700 [Thiothrix sp.]